MRKLVQKVVDINPSIESIPSRLQEFLDNMSRDGWEYCGQIGMSCVFKRWEEEPVVCQDRRNYGSTPYTPYNNSNYQGGYRPYTPNFQPYQNHNPQPYPYNPSNFGTRVDPGEDNKIYSTNPFED